jgi:cytochrome c-type biogenesis protein CcmH
MINPLFLVLALPVLAVVAVCMLWPLLRRRAPVADRAQHDLRVYRDQLAEVDRDQARGLIAEDQAEAARVEIRRRILRAAASGEDARNVGPHGQALRPERASRAGVWITGLAILLPLLAFFTYLGLGRPDLPSLPFAGRTDGQEMADEGPKLREMASSLEAQLARSPQDIDSWIRLGRTQAQLGEMDRAVGSLRRAREQAPQDDRVRVELADLLTSAAGGVVTPEAQKLFEESLANDGEDSADPRVVYFLGVADAQAGDPGAAIQRWKKLLARAPADAPWREQLAESIQVAAAQAGLDPETLPAAPDGGASGMPAAADVEAMAALTPAERDARIRAMVDGLDARLKDAPDDVEGWLRLGRARLVLGENERAAAAYEKAAALRPDDPAILAAWGNALITRSHEPTGLPLVDDRAKAVFERLDKLAPNDPQPAWFLGLAAAQAGDRAGAKAHWQALLDRLPPNHPDRAAIEQLVREL